MKMEKVAKKLDKPTPRKMSEDEHRKRVREAIKGVHQRHHETLKRLAD
jgi:hypothetical protein